MPLIDPENVEEWQFEVRATDLKTAQMKCEAIAAKEPLTEVLSVSQSTVTPYQGTYRFICWFRSEVVPDDNDNDSNS